MSDNMWATAFDTWNALDQESRKNRVVEDKEIELAKVEALLALGQEISGLRDDLRQMFPPQRTRNSPEQAPTSPKGSGALEELKARRKNRTEKAKNN